MSSSKHSLQAYQNIVASGKEDTQLNLIFHHLILHGPKTRKEIALEMDIELSSVTARVNKLIKMGLVKVSQTKVCSISKKTVGLVEVI